MELTMHLTESLTHGGTLSLRPDVVATVLDDGAVLLDLETKYFFALNSSAWSIVQLFETGASMDDARTFAKAAGAPDDDGVDRFLSLLCGYGLFEDVPGEAPALPAYDNTEVAWVTPTIERQAEPLQQVIVSAFDPSIPLAE
jgi:hypothetical protein